jgi:hypothetical protein
MVTLHGSRLAEWGVDAQLGATPMIEIVWEIVVKEGARGPFELAYGPGGAWSRGWVQPS